MIETVAQFLEELKEKGIRKIADQDNDITHPVAVGNIFEGLTAQILESSIFKGLDLRIVQNSFIYNESGKLSKEMDCMIVIGEGKQISYTDQYKYHIKDVIAVVQVKKTLYRGGIDDVHQNLISVIETAEPRNGESYMRRIQYDAYKSLINKILPTSEQINDLSWQEQMIYHFLLMQAFWPLRILIGYNSYKCEYALREGFIKHLELITENGPRPGYSPISFPDLMICGNYSIIKNVGMPFGYPLDLKEEFYWEALVSGKDQPMYYLLELIWTRLSYKFSLGSQIFGDDFKYESFHPLIKCRERQIEPGKFGWEYMYIPLTQKQLSKKQIPLTWQPIEIDTFEEEIILLLCEKGRLKCDDELVAYFKTNKRSLDELINDWTNKHIAYLEGEEIVPLIEEALMITEPNGKIYLGENKCGAMSNWINKRASQKNHNTE